MSEKEDRLERYRVNYKRKISLLQEIYEQRGGEGSVLDFLEMGATDPEDGKEQHWETMTNDEQKLWLGLHSTGLTGIDPKDFYLF